ncbi:MAG TPA: beta-eliminating lyase-related protein, partial [Chitinophagaceae bacterium]|nr:beta-eliminating lyase-related protein [Chitinophagaceae bacterium]
ISEYCRSNNIKLHLDGARIYMAAAWSGTSIKEYASYFDTIYISLYKYLGASAGAVLSGEKKFMEKMPHLVKIHGGTMYGNWANAAMALSRLEGIEDRLKESIKRSEQVFDGLNKIPGVKISSLDNGTNIYSLQLPGTLDVKKLNEVLTKQYMIRIPRPNDKNLAFITVNETLLSRDAAYVIDAFTNAIKTAGG